jgi:hypothetical protein
MSYYHINTLFLPKMDLTTFLNDMPIALLQMTLSLLFPQKQLMQHISHDILNGNLMLFQALL